VAIQNLNGSSSRNVFLDANRGIHPDCQAIHRFAIGTGFGTTYQTVWDDGGGIYTFPTSALTMSCVSSSASDRMGLYIGGLDANYRQISEVITLAGLTPVTTTKQFFRINDLQIMSGENVGNIQVTNNGTTYGHISALFGIQQSTVFTVPAEHTFYITQVDFLSGTIGANKYGYVRSVMKLFDGPILRFFESTFVTSQVKFEPVTPFTVPSKSDFSIEAKSSSGTNDYTVYINGILIKE
jgi:hypothetical protein